MSQRVYGNSASSSGLIATTKENNNQIKKIINEVRTSFFLTNKQTKTTHAVPNVHSWSRYLIKTSPVEGLLTLGMTT